MSTQGRPRPSYSVLLAIAAVVVSLPAAWALEALVRHLILPRQFGELRQMLEPMLTPVAWLCAILTVPANAGAIYAHRFLVKRAIKPTLTLGERQWKLFEILMISASLAQLAGLVAVFLSLLGAGSVPVAVAIISSSVGVAMLAREAC